MANILIVEDEKNMQSIIAEYMQRGGHTCFTADDGVDALMILKNNPMDLMILDVMMPHLDGFSVCKMAREMSNLPIMYLSIASHRNWVTMVLYTFPCRIFGLIRGHGPPMGLRFSKNISRGAHAR